MNGFSGARFSVIYYSNFDDRLTEDAPLFDTPVVLHDFYDEELHGIAGGAEERDVGGPSTVTYTQTTLSVAPVGRATVSRPREDAEEDCEFPGKPTKKLKQTKLKQEYESDESDWDSDDELLAKLPDAKKVEERKQLADSSDHWSDSD